MFSGIIDAVGAVKSIQEKTDRLVLTIAAPGYWSDIPAGASVAIDGVCLTLTQSDAIAASFDVIAETLRRTTFADLREGHRVNLQKSLKIGDRIDGHFVQGHVDGTALIEQVEATGKETMYWFTPEGDLMKYMIPKGSVAIDGISLTIANVAPSRFSVALIPTTLERTTLGSKRRRQRVNIESDILARMIIYRMRDMNASAG